MDYFAYRDGELFCEDVQVKRIAEEVGTPVYIYSTRTILDHFHKIKKAFSVSRPACRQAGSLVCYSVKANSNLAICRLLAEAGAGFDAVSGGEIFRLLKIGVDPKRIVFAGVGKTDTEIKYALDNDILMLNTESWEEIENIESLGRAAGKSAHVCLRLNPDVDPVTHTYITTGKRENKFGIDLEKARAIVQEIKNLKNVKLVGLHMHIGSQILKVKPYKESLTKLLGLIPWCQEQGHQIEWINIGGGFGIFYKEKEARLASEFAEVIIPLVKPTGCRLVLEPGRFIVGNAGVLITQVLYLKDSGDRCFVICDAGINDLIRPALYQAYHKIWPVRVKASLQGPVPDETVWEGETIKADIVGPICETGDFFARDRKIPPVKRGDFLSIFGAGAYGYMMSSNYNSQPRPAEILVRDKDYQVVTSRETYEDLIRRENLTG